MGNIPDSAQITELLHRVKDGDTSAEQELAPLIYEELRRMARNCMRREKPGHTLQTTGLVHEAYLRLIGRQQEDWQDRIHFFSVAANVMRHVLTDYARSRKAAKRGGDAVVVAITDGADPGSLQSWDKILDVDAALSGLAGVDPRAARVVELRFFAGLDNSEIANLLGVSDRTVKRDWEFAQAWLFAKIAKSYRHTSPIEKMSPAPRKSRLQK
ncbi:MAG: sigma-70 family RNA polymerase sigma factor [Bryobacteraceae bacterium]|jgi:RNA polymerase sigma factor (TIGR02999 family)